MQSYRQEINLIGGGFQHTESTNTHPPKYIKWIKNAFTSPVSIYVDYALRLKSNPETKNYGWLCESKTINNDLYSWCSQNISFLKENFISIFTHDVSLSKLSTLFTLTQCSSKSFLDEEKIYEKSKLVSMIASNKVRCNEHKFRQHIIKKYSKYCDHYGRGYKEIPNKLTGLKDYCFSFAMENATYPNMFTEKITDCFVTGTIPIYYGIENISDFFNKDGIIVLDENFKIEDLSFDLYKSKMNAIKENFEISKNMLVAEDYIYINFIKPNFTK